MSNTKYIPGGIVELAGIKFVVLDDLTPERSSEEEHNLFILTWESQGQSVFGETNNYAGSELRKKVDAWSKHLCGTLNQIYGSERPRIVNRKLDLTTFDGNENYGDILNVTPLAAPLTLDEMRKYAKIIPNPDEAFWLATGWGGPKHFGSADVLYVSPDGSLSSNFCSSPYGIRPAIIVPSSLLEKRGKKNETKSTDISSFSTEELLAELSRRTKN